MSSGVRVANVCKHKDDYYCLGQQLESFDIYKSISEEEGSLAQLGRIPHVAYDVLTVAYGQSPVSVIASVQPIDEETGSVRI